MTDYCSVDPRRYRI